MKAAACNSEDGSVIRSMAKLLAVGAFLCIAQGAFAQCPANSPTAPPSQTTAAMNLCSPGTNPVDNIYVGPYYAMINGVQTPVICDDFADESFVPETWTANVTTFSNPNLIASDDTTVRFGSPGLTSSTSPTQYQAYEEAAWLAQQLVATSNTTTQAYIQYAMWSVFEQGEEDSYLAGYYGSDTTDLTGFENNVDTWLTAAQNQTFTSGEFSNVTIYTPVDGTQNCPTYPGCGGGPPQEFMTVATPEPSQVALLGFDFLGVGALVFFLRRRRQAQ